MSRHDGPPDPNIYDRNGDAVVLPTDGGKVVIYSADGTPLQVERVDARELLAAGRYFAKDPTGKAGAGADEGPRGGGGEKAAGGN